MGEWGPPRNGSAADDRYAHVTTARQPEGPGAGSQGALDGGPPEQASRQQSSPRRRPLPRPDGMPSTEPSRAQAVAGATGCNGHVPYDPEGPSKPEDGVSPGVAVGRGANSGTREPSGGSGPGTERGGGARVEAQAGSRDKDRKLDRTRDRDRDRDRDREKKRNREKEDELGAGERLIKEGHKAETAGQLTRAWQRYKEGIGRVIKALKCLSDSDPRTEPTRKMISHYLERAEAVKASIDSTVDASEDALGR